MENVVDLKKFREKGETLRRAREVKEGSESRPGDLWADLHDPKNQK